MGGSESTEVAQGSKGHCSGGWYMGAVDVTESLVSAKAPESNLEPDNPDVSSIHGTIQENYKDCKTILNKMKKQYNEHLNETTVAGGSLLTQLEMCSIRYERILEELAKVIKNSAEGWETQVQSMKNLERQAEEHGRALRGVKRKSSKRESSFPEHELRLRSLSMDSVFEVTDTDSTLEKALQGISADQLIMLAKKDPTLMKTIKKAIEGYEKTSLDTQKCDSDVQKDALLPMREKSGVKPFIDDTVTKTDSLEIPHPNVDEIAPSPAPSPPVPPKNISEKPGPPPSPVASADSKRISEKPGPPPRPVANADSKDNCLPPPQPGTGKKKSIRNAMLADIKGFKNNLKHIDIQPGAGAKEDVLDNNMMDLLEQMRLRTKPSDVSDESDNENMDFDSP